MRGPLPRRCYPKLWRQTVVGVVGYSWKLATVVADRCLRCCLETDAKDRCWRQLLRQLVVRFFIGNLFFSRHFCRRSSSWSGSRSRSGSHSRSRNGSRSDSRSGGSRSHQRLAYR